jgi:hypothetical protein
LQLFLLLIPFIHVWFFKVLLLIIVSAASKKKQLIVDLLCCLASTARHVLCEKQGKINEAYKKLQDGWLDNGDKVPPAEFAKVKSRLMSTFYTA